MAEGKRQHDRPSGAPPPGVRIGPRGLLPSPANENQPPARLRIARMALLLACVAALAWSLRGLLQGV